MSAVRALWQKEARDILRERTIVAALGVQLMIAALSTVLAVGVTVLTSPEDLSIESDAPVAYSGPGRAGVYLEQEGLRLRETSRADALTMLAQGRVAAAIIENRSDPGPVFIEVHVEEGSLQSVIVVPAIREALEQYQEDLRMERQELLATQVVAAPEAEGALTDTFANTVLVPLLLLTPAFLSGAIAGDSWTRERQAGTMVLLRQAPLSPGQIMAGKLVVPLALAPVQAALWLGVLRLGGASVQNVPVLLAFCTLIAAFLAGLGVVVAARARSTVSSQTGYAGLVLVAAVLSLLLPRDLFNALALTASGSVLPDVWLVLGILALTAAAGLAAGLLAARRSLSGR